MSKRHDENPVEDEGIEELLRQVGARDEPPSAVVNDVRQAVYAEWRAAVAERSRRRRTFAYGLAASIAFVMVVLAATFQWMAPVRAPAATIASIDGLPEISSSDSRGPARVGQVLKVGDELRTNERTRVALAFGDGLSVRIGAHSSIQIAAQDRVVLNAGAVYIDSDPAGAKAATLAIATRAGDVRHLGTQYQVRQDAEHVLLSIREGLVEIRSPQGSSRASAGETLRIDQSGAVERGSVTAYDPSWRWAVEAAPALDIDNRPLTEFLNWVARETGKRIVFATAQAQQISDKVVLRGSIQSMDPETALAVVLSTTELRRFETNAESIGIELVTR